MKFRFMEDHQGAHSVGKMAKVLKISRSGYYAWRCRPLSGREQTQKRLKEEISVILLFVTYADPPSSMNRPTWRQLN
jgi:hypothetical protein